MASHATTIKQFFGYKEGQGAKDFVAEMRQLSDTDKEQLATGITDGSLNY